MCKIADWMVLLFLGMCSFCDWKKREIPVLLLASMSVAVLCLTMLCHSVGVWERAGGGLLGVLFLLVSKCTQEAIGYGDSWLILLLGVYLGSMLVLQTLFAASLLAGSVSLFLLWKCRWKRGVTLPFVPFLAISYLGVILI